MPRAGLGSSHSFHNRLAEYKRSGSNWHHMSTEARQTENTLVPFSQRKRNCDHNCQTCFLTRQHKSQLCCAIQAILTQRPPYSSALADLQRQRFAFQRLLGLAASSSVVCVCRASAPAAVSGSLEVPAADADLHLLCRWRTLCRCALLRDVSHAT